MLASWRALDDTNRAVAGLPAPRCFAFGLHDRSDCAAPWPAWTDVAECDTRGVCGQL